MFIRFKLFSPEGDAGNGGGGTLLGGAGGGAGTTATTQQTTQTTQSSGDQSPPSFDFRSVIGADGKFVDKWTEKLPDHLKPAAQEFGKYPTIQDFLGGHWSKAQMLGQRPTVKPPAPDAKPEEVAAWRKTLGVPDAPEGYGLKKPEQLPEGVEWDDAEVSAFAKFAHEQNLTPAQVAKLVEFDISRRSKEAEGGKQAIEQFKEGQKNALQAKWGDKLTDNMVAAKKAAGLLGLDPDDPELGNSAKLIEALYEASKLFSEDKLLGADKAGTGMSGAQQAEDIRRNPSNPWHNAYHGKEGKDRQQEASAMVARLQGVKLQ